MIKIIDEDILNATEPLICHQTNCAGIYGSGVASQLKLKFPKSYLEYQNLCKVHSEELLLGKFYICNPEKNKMIGNIFGQGGVSSTYRMTNYEALYESLSMLRQVMEADLRLTIAIPYKIGCGVGGGDWTIVSAMLESVFSKVSNRVTLYRYNQ